MISSSLVKTTDNLDSFSAVNLNFEKFEREIHENFGIGYNNHPWVKPVRYPKNMVDQSKTHCKYPFFAIDSDDCMKLVFGPIHAGVIEPGHFRFICNGEQIPSSRNTTWVSSHRGIEQQFLEKKKLSQLVTLAESITGDTGSWTYHRFCTVFGKGLWRHSG